jgi:hypothetical protein
MSISYAYLPDRDKWRVEWEGRVSVEHDLSEAMNRVFYPAASVGPQVAAPACQSADDSPVRGWDPRGRPFGIEPIEKGVCAEKPDTRPVHVAWEHRRVSSLRPTD